MPGGEVRFLWHWSIAGSFDPVLLEELLGVLFWPGSLFELWPCWTGETCRQRSAPVGEPLITYVTPLRQGRPSGLSAEPALRIADSSRGVAWCAFLVRVSRWAMAVPDSRGLSPTLGAPPGSLLSEKSPAVAFEAKNLNANPK